MADIKYPPFAKDRGPKFWSKPGNLWASRQKLFRLDYSNEWRYSFGSPNPISRTVSFSRLTEPVHRPDGSFKFVILGDTGEGDRSQYGLLPLINALKPDFMIINGDVAYPAGRTGTDNRDDDDFLAGFFEPYRNLGIPVWATPGNHEYYSPGDGREFYDIFCTRKHDRLWAKYGLRHEVLQPGMFWELNDNDGKSDIVVLGIDSGKNANLDGSNSWWQFWKKKIYPDSEQHAWLDTHLRIAQANGKKVILLFHIPALVNEEHKENDLSTLHRIIAGYSCIRFVLCGHEHNFQWYAPSVFSEYLQKQYGVTPSAPPSFAVAGSSGASLEGPDFDGEYKCGVFPTKDQWKEAVGIRKKVVTGLNLDKTALGKYVARLEQHAKDDDDAARYLTLVLVEVAPGSSGLMETTVTPYLMEDLEKMFPNLPPGEIIDVTSRNLSLDPVALQNCKKYGFKL